MNSNTLKELNHCEQERNTGVSTVYLNCSGVEVFSEQWLDSKLDIASALTHLREIKARPRGKEVPTKDSLLVSFQSIHGIEGIQTFVATESSITVIFNSGIQIYQPKQRGWLELTISTLE